MTITMRVTIRENDDELDLETITRNLDGFELEFDAVSEDGEEHEVKVLLHK